MGAPLYFSELTRQLKDSLQTALALEPLGAATRFENVLGSHRNHPARLWSTALRGPNIRYARFVTLVGDGLEIGNVLVIPAANTALPIFGADIVGLGGDTVVAAADLSAVEPDGPTTALPVQTLPRAGMLPGWAARWFSPHAFSTRTTAVDAPAVARTVTAFAEAFIALVKTARPIERDLSDRHHEYCRDHREGDRALGMLGKIFGPELSAAFTNQVLFPEVIP